MTEQDWGQLREDIGAIKAQLTMLLARDEAAQTSRATMHTEINAVNQSVTQLSGRVTSLEEHVGEGEAERGEFRAFKEKSLRFWAVLGAVGAVAITLMGALINQGVSVAIERLFGG